MIPLRRPTRIDRVFDTIDRARTLVADTTPARRPSPSEGHDSPAPMARDRPLIAGFMRINHTGEVCAQALYLGQASVAETAATRDHLLRAADEEHDHLVWCAERLDELGAKPSRLNPLWYVGAYWIGATAARFGDAISLGFVVETERQVEAHLRDHLERLPLDDTRSRAILDTMMREEVEHGDHARARGGSELPRPIQRLMGWCADVMRFVAYRI